MKYFTIITTVLAENNLFCTGGNVLIVNPIETIKDDCLLTYSRTEIDLNPVSLDCSGLSIIADAPRFMSKFEVIDAVGDAGVFGNFNLVRISTAVRRERSVFYTAANRSVFYTAANSDTIRDMFYKMESKEFFPKYTVTEQDSFQTAVQSLVYGGMEISDFLNEIKGWKC